MGRFFLSVNDAKIMSQERFLRNRSACCRALCPHILPAQKQPCQKEHRPQPEDAAEGKQPVAASQSIRTSVGVHSELHQGIGPQQPMTLGADKDAGNAAQQPQKKWARQKLRMTMASTSCAAMTVNAPSSPRSKNRGKVTGGSPGRWAKYLCRRTRTAQTQSRGSAAPALSPPQTFAANRSSGGTGLAMIRFQLCPRCSSRHK